MGKKYVFFIFLFLTVTGLSYPKDYWDFPDYLIKNSMAASYDSVKVKKNQDKYLIFFLEKRNSKCSIKYFSSVDFKAFTGPIDTGIRINITPGFIPQYDVEINNGEVYLIWDDVNGSIKASIRDTKGKWKDEIIVTMCKNFCFKPGFFILNNNIFITYHTESEGRKIDFFVIRSDTNLNNLSSPLRIAKGFTGSFFPFLTYYNNNYYCFWQSRHFSESKTPVFDIYLSSSNDGITWRSPINLTGDLPGEKRIPYAMIEKDRINLYYESDSKGTWGVYKRIYRLDGIPDENGSKLNRSIANTRDYRLLFLNKKNYLFYMDEKDGNYKVYYQTLGINNNKEYRLKTGKYLISKYDLIGYKDKPYVFYNNRSGIAWIGPDRTALPPEIYPVKRKIIGRDGIDIHWKQPADSSGLEGYCYIFTDHEGQKPEIVNLPPEIKKLRVIGNSEGTYYFKIRSRDIAGNFSQVVNVKLKVDLIPPDSPDVIAPGLDKNRFFKDNKAVFKWKVAAKDVAGFNYAVTRFPININKSKIISRVREVIFKNLKEGLWYFNVVAIDSAENISKTTHFVFRLKAFPQRIEQKKKEIKKIPTITWVISRKPFTYNPIISLLLYLMLILLFIVVIIVSWALAREIIRKRMNKMEEVASFVQVKKKKIGLRFKFSILIVSLILVLTVGISGVLSYVTIKKEKSHLSLQMIDKAKITLENITNVAREGILSNDELLLVSVIAKTMGNKDIKNAIILDNNNRVIAHSDIREKGKILNDKFTVKASKANNVIIDPKFEPEHLARLYNFGSPVIFAHKRIGTVRLGYSTESIFRAIDESKKNSIYSTVIVTIITIIIGIISAVLMATITIKPIKILAKGAYIIGSGNLDYKIHIKVKDEIGVLADEFNRMTGKLAQYQKEMEKKAKLDEQIEIARSIQQNLIPGEGIDNEFVSIGGFYKAATGVGGDYYDFIVKNEKYSLIISDVAGKGVPASLMMTMIRTVFRSLINSGVMYPPRVVTLINNILISDISSDRFATLLFGIYDQKKRYFKYTNAGYGPIMIYKRNKNECFLVESKKSSIPIGVLPDVTFSEEKAVVLNSGDALILFTDGIHEARNEREEEYGMERLARIIPGLSEQNASKMANAIIEDVMSFVGNAEQYDDMALLVLKVK